METKSLNCASCGAGLKSVSLGSCVCSYCGNTNKILSDGITMIDKPKQKANSGTEKGFKDLTNNQKLIVVGMAMMLPFIITRFSNRK